MVITFLMSHRVLPVYQISSKSTKLFVDGRTYGRTDGNLAPIVLGRLPKFGSRPKNRHQALDVAKSDHTVEFLFQYLYLWGVFGNNPFGVGDYPFGDK